MLGSRRDRNARDRSAAKGGRNGDLEGNGVEKEKAMGSAKRRDRESAMGDAEERRGEEGRIGFRALRRWRIWV